MSRNSELRLNAGTFMVRFTLGNHQPTYEYWREQAEKIVKDVCEAAELDREMALQNQWIRKQLSERLQRVFPVTAPLEMWELPKFELTSLLSEVDWHDVADQVLQGLESRGDSL